MNWQVRMTKVDARALKAKYRLELIMQELGEQFEISSDRWRSKTTPGLIVNIQQQIYEYQQPGMDKKTGDLFDWLKWRFGWSFKMIVAYLRKRDPDPSQDAQSAPVSIKAVIPAKIQLRSSESEYPDREKEASGLYECGVGYRDGQTYYLYLLKPVDRWQERALEIGGEKMRKYFTWKACELLFERDLQPSRFIPVQDMDITTCDECQKPIEWWWKQEPQYVYQEALTPGSAIAFKKVRVIDEPQAYAFEYELYEETFCICETCKRKMINYREALSLLYRSTLKREDLGQEKQYAPQHETAPRV